MYTQSSLLLCNAGQSRRCVQLKLVSICYMMVPPARCRGLEKGTLLDFKALVKGLLRASLNILTGGGEVTHKAVNWVEKR
jgi:hypothetical protein